MSPSLEPRISRPGHLRPSERSIYGATVTWVDLDTKEVRTLAETRLTAMQALEAIIATAATWEGNWRIRCISTPITIYRDLLGSRSMERQNQSEKHHNRLAEQDHRPERNYLGRVGRLDLLEPRRHEIPAVAAETRR